MSTVHSYRICPKCRTHRQVTESFCESPHNGSVCGWSLLGEEIIEPTFANTDSESSQSTAVVPNDTPVCECVNGHLCSDGDLLCSVCGADLQIGPQQAEERAESAVEEELQNPLLDSSISFGMWRVVQQLNKSPMGDDRFVVVREGDSLRCLLTYYKYGGELEPDVERVLGNAHCEATLTPTDSGVVNGRRFSVCDFPVLGTVRELRLNPQSGAAIEEFVRAFAHMLLELSNLGLRHRKLTPETVWIRSSNPLRLAVNDFSGARLSTFDLEFRSPLDVFGYMAPESLTGAVSAASDWWGMGMILLDLLSGGDCFLGAGPELFMMNVQCTGVPIGVNFSPRLSCLLGGLLSVDRAERWQESHVDAWLRGDDVRAAATGNAGSLGSKTAVISLGGTQYTSARSFALAAFSAVNWDEAATLVEQRGVAAWAKKLSVDSTTHAALDQVAVSREISADLKLAITIKLLDRSLPLVQRGLIISPAWLEQDEARGYQLISGSVPPMLLKFDLDSHSWLQYLARRLRLIQGFADRHQIQLDTASLQKFSLKTSTSELYTEWQQRRKLWPDSNLPALQSILSRRVLTDENLLLLLAASISQFRTVDEIVESVESLAVDEQLVIPDSQTLRGLLACSREELYALVDERTRDLAQCRIPAIDEWADEYRRQASLDLEPMLLLLSVAADSWVKPPYQDFLRELLSFFERKVSGSVLRGPLVRMTIGKTTPRVDLSELATERDLAEAILQNLLERQDKRLQIAREVFEQEPNPAGRLRRLQSHTLKYLRDTGLDGLYLGFPFLLVNDRPNTRKPRLAPVLLWPVKVEGTPGNYDVVSLSFDTSREEVRLNPAFEGLLGKSAADRWLEAAESLLKASNLRLNDVMSAFALLAERDGDILRPLPALTSVTEQSRTALIPSAVLFHMEFVGQSLIEDLRSLPGREVGGTALETMLRISEGAKPSDLVPEASDKYQLGYHVGNVDPSQEWAISTALNSRGLVIQGPPGTGKSQTIVNLVSDAIGQGKTVLVVCQKLPALEVVRKRLVAGGLQNRVGMVTDINRDQREICTEIGEQVREVLTPDLFGSSYSGTRRDDLVQQIERLEQDLDAQHRASMAPCVTSGILYSSLIDELLEIEEGLPAPIVDVSELMQFLKTVSASEVQGLSEVCRVLGDLWFRSQFEVNPFCVLNELGHDELSSHEFRAGFEQLLKAEKTRWAIVECRDAFVEVEDPSAVQNWLQQNGDVMLAVSPTEREGLVECVPYFLQGREGHALFALVSELQRLFQGEPDVCRVLPQLQVALQECADDQLRAVAQFFAVHLVDWMDSRFGTTPFRQLRNVQFNEESLNQLRAFLDVLADAEQRRTTEFSQEYSFPELTSAETTRRWLEQYEQLIRNLTRDSAKQVAELHGLFRGEKRGKTIISGAESFLHLFADLDFTDLRGPWAAVMGTLASAGQLSEWQNSIGILSEKPRFLDLFRSRTRQTRRRARDFLLSQGLPADTEAIMRFGRLLGVERRFESVRRQWSRLWPPEGADAAWSGDLFALSVEIKAVLQKLKLVSLVIDALDHCPVAADISEDRLGSPSEYLYLVESVRQGLRRFEARDAGLQAVGDLKPWMLSGWLKTAADQIAKSAEPSVTNCIQELLEARNTLEPFLRMRSAIAEKQVVSAAILEAVDPVRATLRRDFGQEMLARSIKGIILYNGLAVRLTGLQSQMSVLLPSLPVSGEEFFDVVRRLARVQEVAHRISCCPFAGDLMNTKFDESKLRRLFEQLQLGVKRSITRTASISALRHLADWMQPDWVELVQAGIAANSLTQHTLLALESALPTLSDYLAFYRRWRELDVTQQRLFSQFSAMRAVLSDSLITDKGQWLRQQFRRACLLAWKLSAERRHPELLGKDVESRRKVESLREQLGELMRLDREHLAQSYDRSALGSRNVWSRILSSPRASIRHLFGRPGDDPGLRVLRPVWLMIPTAVSQVLPLEASLFDLVVFDEASQMPVEHALPSLFRAKSVVVSGDDKQMPPASFFMSRSKDADAYDDDYEGIEQADDVEDTVLPDVTSVTNCPDLLHLADSVLPQSTLQIHYRSRYRELISFSNNAFYENKLSLPIFNPAQKVKADRPVVFIEAEGTYTSQSNVKEAECVIDYLAKMWRSRDNNRPSVGIVTFNRKQADLIEEMLEKRAESKKEFRDVLLQEQKRNDEGEDVSLFVKNVENVQGDERDLIIFSTTFGPDAAGTFRRNFGVLGQRGGERRLNVAVTRAKQKIVVVCSMPIDRICDQRSRSTRPRQPREYLQDYLSYVRFLSSGDVASAKKLLNQMLPQVRQNPGTFLRRSDGLKSSIASFLKGLGYKFELPDPDPVLGIDFVVLDPLSGEAAVGIDCSLRSHPLMKNARMREIWRVSLLKQQYRSFLRISAREWYHNRASEQSRLAKELKAVIGTPQ